MSDTQSYIVLGRVDRADTDASVRHPKRSAVVDVWPRNESHLSVRRAGEGKAPHTAVGRAVRAALEASRTAPAPAAAHGPWMTCDACGGVLRGCARPDCPLPEPGPC